MKHLAVLEATDLVATTRVGRTKLHYLNPVPSARSPTAGSASTPNRSPARWSGSGKTSSVARHRSLDMAITKHVYQIFIKATPNRSGRPSSSLRGPVGTSTAPRSIHRR